MAFKALSGVALLPASDGDTIAVVMLRDADSSEDKRGGLRQAAAEPSFAALHAVVGVADKMREAWVLNGFFRQRVDGRHDAVARECGTVVHP